MEKWQTDRQTDKVTTVTLSRMEKWQTDRQSDKVTTVTLSRMHAEG